MATGAYSTRGNGMAEKHYDQTSFRSAIYRTQTGRMAPPKDTSVANLNNNGGNRDRSNSHGSAGGNRDRANSHGSGGKGEGGRGLNLPGSPKAVLASLRGSNKHSPKPSNAATSPKPATSISVGRGAPSPAAGPSGGGKGKAAPFDSFDLGPPVVPLFEGGDDKDKGATATSQSLFLVPLPPHPEQQQQQLQQVREERSKELSDLSVDGVFSAAAAAAAGQAQQQLQQGDNKSHESNDTDNTEPTASSSQDFLAQSGNAAAAGAAAAGAAGAAAGEGAAGSDSDSDADVLAASLGLTRRHRRRASHPPKSMTETELERNYEILWQLRRMEERKHQQKRQQQQGKEEKTASSPKFAASVSNVSSEDFHDNDELGKSVRFRSSISDIAPSLTSSGRAARQRSFRTKTQSDVSATEWQMNPLEKEAEAVAKAKADRQEERQRRLQKKRSGALNERSRKEYTFVLCAGMCLAFNSGYINGACLSGLLLPSGARVSVSAFTGSYTKSALSLAGGDASQFGFLISMILCFIGGSCLTSIINPRAKPYQLSPQYGPTFLLGSLFLVISSILSELQPHTRGTFYFAAAANGLQNGMSSTYSGNLIRSSHYTGISTDMGLILGQCLRGNRTSLWKLWVLMGLTFSFWMGGFVAWHATGRFLTHSLVFNACFFFLIGVGLIMFVAFINHVTVWQAAFGTWHWERALESLASVHSIRSSIQDKHGKAASEDFLVELFDKIDTDQSGTIDEEELYEALRDAGMSVSKKGIKAMMKHADKDGDGIISKDEWEDLVKGMPSKSNSGDSDGNNGDKGGDNLNRPLSAKEAAAQVAAMDLSAHDKRAIQKVLARNGSGMVIPSGTMDPDDDDDGYLKLNALEQEEEHEAAIQEALAWRKQRNDDKKESDRLVPDVEAGDLQGTTNGEERGFREEDEVPYGTEA